MVKLPIFKLFFWNGRCVNVHLIFVVDYTTPLIWINGIVDYTTPLIWIYGIVDYTTPLIWINGFYTDSV